MANTIRLKRSAVSGRAPTTSDLALGEIAINTFDGKVYIKKDNGTPSIVEIGAGGGGGGSATVGPVLEPAYYIAENQTFGNYRNGLSVSPVEVASGYSVTVPAGATWWIADLENELFNSGITVGAAQTARFRDADGSNWVGLRAPATVAANVTWRLPAADGLVGQLLTTDGAGGLGWANRESKAKSYFYASF